MQEVTAYSGIGMNGALPWRRSRAGVCMARMARIGLLVDRAILRTRVVVDHVGLWLSVLTGEAWGAGRGTPGSHVAAVARRAYSAGRMVSVPGT